MPGWPGGLRRLASDGFEQQRVDAGPLVGGVAGAEFGDGVAVLGLGGELAHPGGDRGLVRAAVGCPAPAGRGLAGGAGRPGRGMVSPGLGDGFLAQASSTRSLTAAAAAAAAALAVPAATPGR